jgi:Ribbon-helix-helix domain
MSRRTQVTLSDEQYARLRDLSVHSGVGLAELVRRAVDRTYGSRHREELLAALDDSFGGWDTSDEDGAAYVDDLRTGMASRLPTYYNP